MKRCALFIFFCLIILSDNLYSLTNSFEAISFRPTSDNGRYFNLWDSSTLKKKEWLVGTSLTYSYKSFQIFEGGSFKDNIIDHTLIEHFYGSVGIIDKWLNVGLEFPAAWWMNYRNPNIAGSPWENKMTLGDLRLNLKTNFYDLNGGRIGFALVPFISLPTGKGEYFMSQGGVAGGGNFVVETKLYDRLWIMLNAGVMGKKKYLFRNLEKGNQLIGGLGLSVDIKNNLAASAELSFDAKLTKPFAQKVDTQVEAIAGVKYTFPYSGISLNGAAGGGIIHGTGVPAFRMIAGISFNPRDKKTKPPKEVDYQQLLKLKKECPSDPSEYNRKVHGADCLKVYKFEGGSPENKEKLSVYVMALSDMQERCPKNPKDFNPKIHAAGCEKFYDIKDAFRKLSKCPAPDLFVSGRDDPECAKIYEFLGEPNVAEWKEIVVSAEKYYEQKAVGKIEDIEPIQFGFDSAVVSANERKRIQKVVDYINGNVGVRKILVGGHCDNIGTREVNRSISRMRAEMVVREMKKLGLRGDIEIKIIPYDFSRPLVPNSSKENRALNRRVTFEL